MRCINVYVSDDCLDKNRKSIGYFIIYSINGDREAAIAKTPAFLLFQSALVAG